MHLRPTGLTLNLESPEQPLILLNNLNNKMKRKRLVEKQRPPETESTVEQPPSKLAHHSQFLTMGDLPWIPGGGKFQEILQRMRAQQALQLLGFPKVLQACSLQMLVFLRFYKLFRCKYLCS